MDLTSPDTDIPGVYRDSSVPLSLNTQDPMAMQQAVASALSQRYPVSPSMGIDAETTILQLLNLLHQQTNSPQQPQMGAMPGMPGLTPTPSIPMPGQGTAPVQPGQMPGGMPPPPSPMMGMRSMQQ